MVTLKEKAIRMNLVSMNPYKVIFMGTPEFACPVLEALVSDKRIEVPLVVTQPDAPRGRKLKLQASPVKEKAQNLNLEVFSPDKISDEKNFKLLKEIKPDLVLVLAYGQILKQSLLDLFPDRFINIHASLLPRWRGAAPIQRALMEGDKVSGVSYQIMRLKLDSGPLVFKEEFTLPDSMDSKKLAEELSSLSAKTAPQVVVDYLEGRLVAKEQKEADVTYAAKIKKEESLIFWDKPAKKIHNEIRGLQWGPGAYTLYKGKRLKVSKTCFSDGACSHAGSVISLDKGVMWVGTSQGLLGLQEVQPEGKAKMNIESFKNGYQVKEGERLGE